MNERASYQAARLGSERQFGLLVGGVLAVLSLLPLIKGGEVRYWLLIPGLALFALGLVAPAVLKPLNWLWFQLGLLLGKIIAPIIMALVFFIVVWPTGLFMKLRGADLLKLKWDDKASSYWTHRDGKAGSMRNQF